MRTRQPLRKDAADIVPVEIPCMYLLASPAPAAQSQQSSPAKGGAVANAATAMRKIEKVGGRPKLGVVPPASIPSVQILKMEREHTQERVLSKERRPKHKMQEYAMRLKETLGALIRLLQRLSKGQAARIEYYKELVATLTALQTRGGLHHQFVAAGQHEEAAALLSFYTTIKEEALLIKSELGSPSQTAVQTDIANNLKREILLYRKFFPAPPK